MPWTTRRAPPPAPHAGSLVGLLSAAALLAACPAPPTALARAQQVAQEFNQDARFGRDELMLEHVAPSARDGFVARHRGWGTSVRIADLELAGTRSPGDHDLLVTVRVAWYRQDEQELRTTTIRQTWHEAGGWQLTAEQRVEGDVGLLGESVAYQAPNTQAARAQFPTVRLGGSSTEGE